MSRLRLLDVARRIRAALERWSRAAVFVPMERLLPVDRRTWCFGAWGTHPHTMDNPRAVFEQVKDDPSIRKIVLVRGRGRRGGPEDGVDVHFVDVESLRGMYHVARASAILVGYGLVSLCSYQRHVTAKHRVIQLWHGIPLKRIGHLCPGEPGWDAETPRYAATVCSSGPDREIMRQAFAPLPRERVWMTGLPRNDFITGDAAALPAEYRAVLRELETRLAGRKLVLYAPTWRDDAADLYAFSDDEAAALGRVLRAHGAVLGIRGHAMAREHFAADYGSDAVLDLNGIPDVNVVLRVTDVMVTDYSSIYIDFLLTGRPVIHFVHDLERYLAGRGLLYDPADAFGGASARTFAELVACVARALAEPGHDAEQRARATRLFHAHAGGCGRAAAERVRELLAAPDAVPAARAVAAAAQS